jgi:hypothetical protein
LFGFESPAEARVFVERLANRLRKVAAYIEHEQVRVVDGSEEGQHEAIMQLARGSSATMARFGP